MICYKKENIIKCKKEKYEVKRDEVEKVSKCELLRKTARYLIDNFSNLICFH